MALVNQSQWTLSASTRVNGIKQPDGTILRLSPKQIANLLGHSTSEVTELYYIRNDPTALEGVTDGFDV